MERIGQRQSILSCLRKPRKILKKGQELLYRGPLTPRACRVRIVDVVGDDAMVKRLDGSILIVDVSDLVHTPKRKNFA
jgi:hypothetical protein